MLLNVTSPVPSRPDSGQAFYHQGDYPRAESALSEAVSAGSRDPAVYLALGQILFKAGRLDEAESVMKKAEGFGDVGLYLRLAELLRLRNKESQSVKYYSLAAADRGEAGPQDPEGKALFEQERMCALMALHQFNDAFKLAEIILKTHRSQRVFEGFVGVLASRGGGLASLPGTIKNLEAFSKINPDNPWPPFILTDAYDKLACSDQAIFFARALAKVPKRYGWMRWKSGLFFLNEQRDYPTAAREFTAALKCFPDMWQAEANIAEIELCMGSTAKAFRRFDRIVARLEGADKMLAAVWRGELRLWLGEYEEALKDLDLGVSAGVAFSFCWRGAARLQLGRIKEGLDDLEAACRLDPNDREARIWRAEAKRRLGLYRESLSDLSSERDDFFVSFNRALSYCALNNADSARAEIQGVAPAVLEYFSELRTAAMTKEAPPNELVRQLERSLAWTRGLRRDQGYLSPIWMRKRPLGRA